MIQISVAHLIDFTETPASWKCRICRPAHTRQRAVSLPVAIAVAESHLELAHGAEILDEVD